MTDLMLAVNKMVDEQLAEHNLSTRAIAMASSAARNRTPRSVSSTLSATTSSQDSPLSATFSDESHPESSLTLTGSDDQTQ